MRDVFGDRAALVTGASRGIGRQIALQLASAGARVALAARGAEELERVALACRQRSGREAVSLPTDVAVPAECERLVAQTVGALGGLDLLVLNAAISMVVRFEDLGDLEPLERLMRVNYFGAVYPTRHALPHLRRSRGRILVLSSLAALTGVPTRTGYAASKRALDGFFDSLRIELAESGVSVTVVRPGFVDTGIRERAAGAGTGRGTGPAAGRLMSADVCARRALRAATSRRRELVMTAPGRVGRWLRLVAPGLVDRVAARAVGA